MQMNATIKKFGYPATLVKDFSKWVILQRPQQVTLGSLVLACTEKVTALSALSPEAFAELHEITGAVEGALARGFAYDKINYLMLMMVDPDVHFHILPRYAQTRSFAGRDFYDYGWPGPPDFTRVNATDEEVTRAILDHLRSSL